jgi:trimeric autotransporter adhesin
MIIDHFMPKTRHIFLLFLLATTTLLLSACGGSDKKKSSTTVVASSSAASMRSSFTAASIPANGTGTWPSVKVDATSTKQLTFSWSAVPGATYYRLMKNLSGNTGFVQVGSDITGTSIQEDIRVHLQDWINTRYLVEACDGSGCSQNSENIYTATEILKSIGYTKGSNSDANDWFGWSLTVSGDGQTLAVGAPAEDSKAIGINGDQTNNESSNSGAVYVFVKENGLWVQQAYLKASNTEQPNSSNSALFLPNDRFGYKVALSNDGNTLAVSALLEDSPSYGINCNQNNFESTDPVDNTPRAVSTDTGAVYVFQRTNTQWEQEAYVKPRTALIHSVMTNRLRFGETLALSGDGKTLAVGTTSDSLTGRSIVNFRDPNSSSTSSLSCFEFYPSSNSSSSSVSSSILSSTDSSAVSSIALVGGSVSGGVYVYIKLADGWAEESYIKAYNTEAGDAFGASIALSDDGNTLAVGAIGEDSAATGIYDTTSSNNTSSSTSNNSSNSSSSIGPANNGCIYRNAAGIYFADASCGVVNDVPPLELLDNGAAYIFKRNADVWVQQTYVKPEFAFYQTFFGYSIDLSADGMTLAVGAAGDASPETGVGASATTTNLDNPNSGSAYIFVNDGTQWTQQTYIKPSTLAPGSLFGSSLSLSANGDHLVVGAYRESSYAKGIDGDNGDTSANSAGAAYVFKRDGTQWTQKSYVKASNTDINDRFGLSLDLSDDGSLLAVGAHREAGKGFSVVGSSSSQSSSSASSLDQTDNSLEASGAVYLY